MVVDSPLGGPFAIEDFRLLRRIWYKEPARAHGFGALKVCQCVPNNRLLCLDLKEVYVTRNMYANSLAWSKDVGYETAVRYDE